MSDDDIEEILPPDAPSEAEAARAALGASKPPSLVDRARASVYAQVGAQILAAGAHPKLDADDALVLLETARAFLGEAETSLGYVDAVFPPDLSLEEEEEIDAP